MQAVGGWFCESCREAILTDPDRTCPRCSSPVGKNLPEAERCFTCRDEEYAFTSAVRLGPYSGILRETILKLKATGTESLAWRLGELWATHRRAQLIQGDITALVPVPLHLRRRLARGHNQADELACGLASVLGVPVVRRVLTRTRSTPMQSLAASRAERLRNVEGAFRASGRLAGARVLLVDDVLTTGATAHAASVALLRAGAAQVRVAVLAHLSS